MFPMVTFPTMFGAYGMAMMAPAGRGADFGAAGPTAGSAENAIAAPHDTSVGPSSAAPLPTEEDVADPQTALERTIEARNFALLRAGGNLEVCGREAYAFRLTIEKRMPTDPAVPPELRAGRIRKAKEALRKLLEKTAELTRVDDRRLLRELEALHKRFKPITPRSVDALQHVFDVLRERIAETQTLLRSDIEKREWDVAIEIQRREEHGGRHYPILALQAQLRELKELEEKITALLDTSLQADPRAFISEATKAIRKAERLTGPGKVPTIGGQAPAPRRRGRTPKKPKPA